MGPTSNLINLNQFICNYHFAIAHLYTPSETGGRQNENLTVADTVAEWRLIAFIILRMYNAYIYRLNNGRWTVCLVRLVQYETSKKHLPLNLNGIPSGMRTRHAHTRAQTHREYGTLVREKHLQVHIARLDSKV